MKYRPGYYSVTTFDPLGTKLETVWKDDNGDPFDTLSMAGAYVDRQLRNDGVNSYAISRVVVNTAAPARQW